MAIKEGWLWKKRVNIHVEVNNVCNAMCPMCYDRNYIDKDHSVRRLQNGCNYQVSFSEFKSWFSSEFFKKHSIKILTICGTESEPTLNEDLLRMIRYIKEAQPSSLIRVSTNGSTNDHYWWAQFGKKLSHFKQSVQVIVGIDGIGANHEKYRLNTSYSKIIQNMDSFIKEGGTAIWQYLVFDHNQDDLVEAKATAIKMGFYDFVAKYSNYLTRENKEELTFKWKGKVINLRNSKSKNLNREQMVDMCSVNCYSKQKNEFFISYLGKVYPCSWVKSSLKGSYGLNESEKSMKLLNKFTDGSSEISKSSINHILDDQKLWQNLEESWADKSCRPKVCDLYCGARQHESQCYFDIESNIKSGPERQDKIN